MGKLFYDEYLDHVKAGRVNTDYSDASILEYFSVDQWVDQCTVFNIGNVANYLFDQMIDDRSIPTVKELPNIAPQFDSLWFEYKSPDYLERGATIAVVMRSARVHSWIQTDSEVLPVFKENENKKFWSEFIVMVRGDSGEIVSSDVLHMAISDDDGTPLFTRTFTHPDFVDASKSEWILCIPAFLAISFMHCKNVTLETHWPVIHKKNRNRTPRTKYYTLNIRPMRTVLRTEGNGESSGIKHALHICRGHFKDFSKGGGLFGKHKGLYWWESHVRGNPELGTIVKDYNINPPDETKK